MQEPKPRPVEQLQRRNSYYEIEAEVPAIRKKFRLGFTARRTKQALLEFTRPYADELIELAGLADQGEFKASYYAGCWTFGQRDLHIYFSGKTEWQCTCNSSRKRLTGKSGCGCIRCHSRKDGER